MGRAGRSGCRGRAVALRFASRFWLIITNERENDELLDLSRTVLELMAAVCAQARSDAPSG